MSAVFENAALAVPAASASDDVWASIANSYAAFSSPMVPSAEDISLYERIAARHALTVGRNRFDALMLGVTPGIAQMRWPERTRVLAVEISPAVIRALWPGDIPGVREAHCSSWFEMPLEPGAIDLVVGDGSLNACRFPADVHRLSRSMKELLTSDGLLVVRCYVQQERPEGIESVFDALFNARGLSVDAFKMRLYLAMQRSSAEGVAVRDAARVLESRGVDRVTMKNRFGWSDPAIEPFMKWRTSDAVYSFPLLDELRTALGEYFDEVSVTFPSYELGHCCPILVVRSR